MTKAGHIIKIEVIMGTITIFRGRNNFREDGNKGK